MARAVPSDGLAPDLGPIRWSDDAEMLPCREVGVRHVGVMFVHGVGFQAPGETLRAWIAPIVRMLRERARPSKAYSGQDPVRSAGNVSIAGESIPIVELRVPVSPDPAKHEAQHWVFAEAFWADSISPPDLGTVVAWLRHDGIALAAADLTVPNDSNLPDSTLNPNRRPLVLASNRLLLSIFTTIFLLIYVALRAVSKILPIPALRDGILAPMERLLTSWAGDMRVLLFDEAQSARVRTTFAAATKALEASNCRGRHRPRSLRWRRRLIHVADRSAVRGPPDPEAHHVRPGPEHRSPPPPSEVESRPASE